MDGGFSWKGDGAALGFGLGALAVAVTLGGILAALLALIARLAA